MKAFTTLASLVTLAGTVSARTVFSQIAVNSVDQGQDVAIRVPSSNAPITDVTSNDIICNTNFVQPVSTVVANVPAGGSVTAQFHHTSAGYVGPDPSDPLDPTNKGPILAYLAKIPDATQVGVTGLQWFKIFQDGYDSSTHQWGSDKLFINKGNVTFTMPPCLLSGQYLLRVEAISLLEATSYPGAEFYMSCAQINIVGGNNVQPAGVSFPGAYKSTDPGIVTNIFADTAYSPPGPAVFQC